MISSVHKGDLLEDKFYDYLMEQQSDGRLVDGLHLPDLCKIHKKKSYYCTERQANVTFDVVIEIYREGAEEFAFASVFECKNYDQKYNVPEEKITDFSDKLKRIFKHKAKGALVVSTGLQSGARNLVKKRGIGLVKYDRNGFETILPRQSKSLITSSFIEKNIFQNLNNTKSIKFSSYYDGKFFSSIGEFLNCLSGEQVDELVPVKPVTVPYMPFSEIEARASELLKSLSYSGGEVSLVEICNKLSIGKIDECDNSADSEVLGEANFQRNTITIYPHGNYHRERFTIAHEIGHFYLEHGKYLHSDSVLESDLFVDGEENKDNFYRSLEFQANTFASCLLLPKDNLIRKISEIRNDLGINGMSHGFVYVDDQPCNFIDYSHIMNQLSGHFQVSKQAIEIRLKNLNLLTDNRTKMKRLNRRIVDWGSFT